MAVHNAVCSVPATSFYLVPGGPEGRADRALGSLRCTFDGETMSVVESGNELRNTTGRGLEGRHIAGQSSLDASQLRTFLEGIPVVFE